jgi:hypothetical protein
MGVYDLGFETLGVCCLGFETFGVYDLGLTSNLANPINILNSLNLPNLSNSVLFGVWCLALFDSWFVLSIL